jgi:TRAP-type C4-dicarboxylate transport system substrate-binding protein
MEFMGQRVRELSDEKLTVKVYPSEQLGSEQQCVELVQIGSLAITKVSAAVMESFIEDIKYLDCLIYSNRRNMLLKFSMVKLAMIY